MNAPVITPYAIWSDAHCVHSAEGWDGVLKPVVARYRGKVSRLFFRAGAGFANPEIYEYLEAQGIKYAIRLSANRVLQERIGHLLTRPVGRPPNEVRHSFTNFTHPAGTRMRPRGGAAKIEWHWGELTLAQTSWSPRGRPLMPSPSTTNAGAGSCG